jgi:ubiquinone/menaquinone biosynthesis C-methylase UbiE
MSQPRTGPTRAAQVLSTYERVAGRYDRYWRRLWLLVAGGAAETAMLDTVTGAASATAGSRVLDAGAGTGALSRELAQALPGVHPVLVDLSPGMLARAGDLGDPRIVASVAALPFPDGTFDVVMSAWVIETVDDPSVAVTEMLRVLRPGGLVAYSFCSRPARRRDRWRTGPTRAVVHALFAGHFLREEQTPFSRLRDIAPELVCRRRCVGRAAREVLHGRRHRDARSTTSDRAPVAGNIRAVDGCTDRWQEEGTRWRQTTTTPWTRRGLPRPRPGSSTPRRPAASPVCSACWQTRPVPGSSMPWTWSTSSASATCPWRWRRPRTPLATPCASCGTAGLVSTRKDGRVGYYRLSHGFPEPLRDHCLRALVDLSRTVADSDDQELRSLT